MRKIKIHKIIRNALWANVFKFILQKLIISYNRHALTSSEFNSFASTYQISFTLTKNLSVKTKLSLTHSAPKYYEKLALKKAKHPSLNGYISKTRTNSESKLKFSEVNSIFFKTALFLVPSTHVGTHRGLRLLQSPVPPPTARSAQKVKTSN